MHYLPSLDQQAPENPSIFQDNSALVCAFHVGSGAGIGIGIPGYGSGGSGWCRHWHWPWLWIALVQQDESALINRNEM